ncbi:glycosyltransferase family 39 protein [Paenarthrobacter sp. DKR-5]|uniref:ArnT family glycosyltransferase n=1 Tax=Paenarthrobacter sp. DKR-5 TaxID=2835535 RepID=UPI001BDD3F4C|nr:glycosyltransferase family 39 protein [Paenarthrobacter sp. DKR-5]MBT1004372.1 glycosyltransferase family 39 protein [Paenarthrobacter sp. DKR-5]
MTDTAVLDDGLTKGTATRRLPVWHRPVLAGLVVLAGALYAWNLGDSGLSSFYATAAKSMSESWRAFFFGAFDPGASITLDKLAGFVIPQALSARLFGFSQVSVTLPQVIEGMITVLAGYRAVRQWTGAVGGLVAAAALSVTPLLVSMFGHSMEDGMLIMFCVLAVMSWQDSIRSGRLRWLLLAAVWVGLGFQAKMMEAWLVVPALGVAYLLAAPHPVAKRVRHVLVFGAVTLAVSLSWMTAIQLVPAESRPYVDGSTNNNMYSMVFGYNGFNRFIPDVVPGAVKDMAAQVRAGAPGAEPVGANAGFGGRTEGAARAGAQGAAFGAGGAAASPFKLVSATYLSQIGWLYPLAVAGVVLGFRRSKRNPLDRNLHAGVWVSTLWLGVSALVMSAMRIPHTAYLAILAFPLAALSAIGLHLAVNEYRSGASRHSKFLLPALIAVEAGWAVFVAAATGLLEPLLPISIAAAGLLSAAGLSLAAVGRRPAALPMPAVAALAATALLLGPAFWSASVLVPGYAGSAMDAYAGPRASGGAGFGMAFAGGRSGSGERDAAFGRIGRAPAGLSASQALPGRRAGGMPGGFQTASASLSAADQALLRFTQARVGAGEPAFATDSWNTASRFIMGSGANVLPFGGFSGTAPSLSLEKFVSMASSGQLKYVLLSSPLQGASSADGGGMPQRSGFTRGAAYPDAAAIRAWIAKHFVLVPPAQYGLQGATTSGSDLYQFKS